MTTHQPTSENAGRVMRHTNFPSRYIAPRNVDVWCPPEYATNPATNYSVIYMHDGQNLFAPSLAFDGVDWGVEEAMLRVIGEQHVPGAIVVGIWNTAQRRREYMPEKALAAPANQALLDQFVQVAGGAPLSNAYLRFITAELKPFIDATYRTLPDQPHTFLMGSSMGGLISAYGLAEYPNVFGGAGCLSTHWPIGGDELVDYMGAALPRAGRHKLYFDYGTVALDATYEPFQQRMDAHMRAAGYQLDHDWRTLSFEGADHSERAWRARVHIPLAFLLST